MKKERNKATEEMVKEITKNEVLFTTRHDDFSEMWIYRGGIYVPQAKTFIQEFVRAVLMESYTTTICNQVIEKIKADTYIEQDEFFKEEDPKFIAVENGILNLKTKKLNKFNPVFRFFSKIPIKYDGSKDCPKIKRFFHSLFKDMDEVKVIQEVFGFLLYRDYFLEKSLMFLGDGRNGKGKTLLLMKRFVGEENAVEITLEDLENDIYALGELFKKKANLCGDLSKSALKNTGRFKKLTGRDLVTAPRKFKSRVSFQNYAKMIFSANQLPITYDLTEGFWSRWIVLDFPFTFKSQKEMDELKSKGGDLKDYKVCNPDIIEDIVSEGELSGLLNWGIVGLKKLFENGSFSYSPGSKDVEKMWLRKSNSFIAFCMDCIDEDFDSKEKKVDIKMLYNDYCRCYKLKPVTDRVIKYTLSERYGSIDERKMVDGNYDYYYTGITTNLTRLTTLSSLFYPYTKKINSYIGYKTGDNMVKSDKSESPQEIEVENIFDENSIDNTQKELGTIKLPQKKPDSEVEFHSTKLKKHILAFFDLTAEPIDDFLAMYKDRYDEVEQLIFKMAKEGELHEVKPGRYKTLS